ncbi:MAG TPA: DUF447 family protein [Methanoregula sp.]|nr:DUF447 family protein [Methanoregula sp.]
MGLLKSGINEVIATTSFNAAPIGIHFRDNTASMILFAGSHTAENVERGGWVVANFVQDPVIYVKTAFEDLPREAFIEEPVAGLKMCRLLHAEAWVACTATVERKTDVALVVRLKPEKEIIEDVSIHPVNRGFNSIIDATVHATRYRVNRDPALRKLIDYHAEIVRKCGGKKELDALDLLMEYIVT